MKIATKITVLVISLCTLLSVAGVYATWQYSTASANENIQISVGLSTFLYQIKEDEIPEKQKQLAEAIAYDLNRGNSTISTCIGLRRFAMNTGIAHIDGWQKNMIGSMDKRFGENGGGIWLVVGNMVDSLKDNYYKNNGLTYPQDCSFIVDFSNSEASNNPSYTIYTTDVNLSNKNEGESISPVYKTTLIKDSNGNWKVSKYEVGAAITVKYITPNSSGEQTMGFDYRAMAS